MLLNHKVHFGGNSGICYVKPMYVKKINKKCVKRHSRSQIRAQKRK